MLCATHYFLLLSHRNFKKMAAEQTQYTPIKDGMSLMGRMLKRAFDVALALPCMVLASPMMLFCYVAIKREDGGPAIYRQERIGLGGKPFFIYKFRTMRLDYRETEPQLTAEGDVKNLTRIGRWLRDRHIDELPQFWNVLKGDMSFVGPRPERAFFIQQIEARNPHYRDLYQIRPGITSYATLHNGYTYNIEKMMKRLELDLYYLEHRSCVVDMKILWNTLYYIVSGKKI